MYNVQYRRPNAWEDPPEDDVYLSDGVSVDRKTWDKWQSRLVEERYDLSFDDWEQQVHTDEMYQDMLSDYEKLLNRRY